MGFVFAPIKTQWRRAVSSGRGREPDPAIGYHFTPIIIKPRASEKKGSLVRIDDILERKREGNIYLLLF